MEDPVSDAARPAAGQGDDSTRPMRELRLRDCISIIVGIIVGVGIFKTAPGVAANVPSSWMLMAIWGAGGGLSVIGALCYAELATAYPREGGDYVYLNRAYGSWAGFLFAWARLTVIQTGSIGAAAYVFGTYATTLQPLGPYSYMLYAAASVVVLTAINFLGVHEGKRTQNVLTVAKVLGLGGILLVGYLFAGSSAAPPAAADWQWNLPTAMVLVLYTYGGWHEAAYVAAEVQQPQRNLVRALLLGTCFVTLLYLLINGAYLHALGLRGLKESDAVARDVVARSLADPDEGAIETKQPPDAAQLGSDSNNAWPGLPTLIISVLVMVSALGAINGEIFTGARVSYAVGCEHRIFSLLGSWVGHGNGPRWSMVLQGVITLLLVVLLAGGDGGAAGFDTLVIFTAPVFWAFFLLTAISLLVLRWREPNQPRPFQVPLYPLIPLIFCLSCSFMLYSSMSFALSFDLSQVPFYAFGILLAGLPLYWVSCRITPSER